MISPPVIPELAAHLVEDVLRDELLNAAVRPTTSDHHTRMAQIINGLDPADAEDVIQKLLESSPEEAKIIKGMLFSFNDLPKLSQRARALLFDKVSTDVVVLALRGVDMEFRDVALSSLASRARRLVESELSNPSNAPARETAKARKQIADLVLEMVRRDEITISSPDQRPDTQEA
jgi:flagellar motor switch protein FliG